MMMLGSKGTLPPTNATGLLHCCTIFAILTASRYKFQMEIYI